MHKKIKPVKKKKRILSIPPRYYPRIGGMEQSARDFVQALKDDYEEEVFCSNSSYTERAPACITEVDGIRVVKTRSDGMIASQTLSFDYPSKLKKELKEFCPDIIIFHYPNPFATHFLLKYIDDNTKLIIIWHLDIVKQKFLGLFFTKQNYRLLDRATVVVPTSENYIRGSKWLQYAKDKCVVIPNCVNTERLKISEDIRNRAEKIRQLYKDKIICFSVGRHVVYKGYIYLIEASKYLDDRFVFLIAGKGKTTNELKKAAEGDDKVKFLGRIEDEELNAYLLASDIYCFPSITKNEAWGISLAEGMYYGKPTVTFTIPNSGVNYVSLNGVTGIECPNSDSKAYAEALSMLADNPETRLQYGRAAEERILNNFTFEQFKKNARELIDRVLENK